MNKIRVGLWMRLLLIVGAASLVSSPGSAEQSSVTVNVNGVRSQSGNIIICLWRQQDDGFPLCSSSSAFAHQAIAAADSAVAVTFQNVPAGEYAISAFHDEDGDGSLDRGFMGRPEEGIGISNMSQERRERPSFESAKFSLNGTQTLSLSLRYF